MPYIIDEYIDAKGEPGINAVHMTLDYHLGNSSNRRRGYYMHACPVSHTVSSEGLISYGFGLYTGACVLLLPCARKSRQLEEHAKILFAQQISAMIKKIMAAQKVELSDVGKRQAQVLYKQYAYDEGTFLCCVCLQVVDADKMSPANTGMKDEMATCYTCHDYLLEKGNHTRCESCAESFTYDHLQENPENNTLELCPYCGEIWCE